MIGHDGTGPGSGWYVSRVNVDVVSSSSDACQKYVFPCNRWLAKSEGDGKLEVELLPQTHLESVEEKSEKELGPLIGISTLDFFRNCVSSDGRNGRRSRSWY